MPCVDVLINNGEIHGGFKQWRTDYMKHGTITILLKSHTSHDYELEPRQDPKNDQQDKTGPTDNKEHTPTRKQGMM